MDVPSLTALLAKRMRLEVQKAELEEMILRVEEAVSVVQGIIGEKAPGRLARLMLGEEKDDE